MGEGGRKGRKRLIVHANKSEMSERRRKEGDRIGISAKSKVVEEVKVSGKSMSKLVAEGEVSEGERKRGNGMVEL